MSCERIHEITHVSPCADACGFHAPSIDALLVEEAIVLERCKKRQFFACSYAERGMWQLKGMVLPG